MLNFYQFDCKLRGVQPYSESVDLRPLTPNDMARYATPEVSLDSYYSQIQTMDIQNVQALGKRSKPERIKSFFSAVRAEPSPEELKKHTGFDWE